VPAPGSHSLALHDALPIWERPRAQLMLALYRSGRQADALELYRRTRETLSEELGIEPGLELQELERRMLQHDPELERPRPAPRPDRKSTRLNSSHLGSSYA